MTSAQLKREQTKSEPVARRSRPARPPAAHAASSALILGDSRPPGLRLGRTFGATQTGGASQAPSPNRLQAKLAVSEPGDAYEREADSVAERVMRMPDTTVRLQRKCACGGSGGECEECEEKKTQMQRYADTHSGTNAAAPGIVNDVLRSDGQPLDAGTRAFMEPRFGLDLGHVRVHADSRAAKSARAVGALAYTVGRDVVFGAGQYAPGTSAGRHLLAHELAHTLQQTGGGMGLMIQRMAACPATLTAADPVPSGWKAYNGDPCVFHCCYRGILEDRKPSTDDPQNECFYDTKGTLVDASHEFAGCGGTPNQYDSASNPWDHTFKDSGGIWEKGWEAFKTSIKQGGTPEGKEQRSKRLMDCLGECDKKPWYLKMFCESGCTGLPPV